MGDDRPAIGRVCYYAAQQCTVGAGCPTIGLVDMGARVEEVILRALSCELRGLQLYADELASGRFDTRHHKDHDRIAVRDRRMRAQERAGMARANGARGNEALLREFEEMHAKEDR